LHQQHSVIAGQVIAPRRRSQNHCRVTTPDLDIQLLPSGHAGSPTTTSGYESAPQFVVAIRCDTHTSTLKPLPAGLHTLKKVATSAGSDPGENPGTGARGTVTPIADAYTQDGFTCRDFLASYIRDGAESWLQGDACRSHHGKWTVRKMRPLKRS